MTDISDAELLERFVTCRDEAAFAAMMARHGPMVLRVCQRILHDSHAAEDAFQATFLILVRKAASIGKRELLGNWLYGVALRVASRARSMAAKRRTREPADMEQVAVEMRESAEATDLSVAITEEVQKLPAKYRIPVVLYYLEGRTTEEIAGQMCCPVGTTKTRLSRAREMLHKRLIRRGLVLSTAAFSAAMLAEAPAASLPPALIDSTLKAAVSFAVGNAAAGGLVSAQAAALARGVLHTMFVTKMKMLAALLLTLAVLIGGGSAWAYRFPARDADKNDKSKPDVESIRGDWELVSLTTHEAVGIQEAALLKDAAWVFEKEKIIIKGKIQMREVTVEAPYKLEPSKTPRTIDITLKVPGADKERKIEGIYKLQGDNLTICIPLGQDKPRPKELEAKEGSKQCLLEFKRKK